MASTVSSRPIPALYTVYILRSTMRHASLYIGSTPDPPRRLKQHNGAIKGGAARTARESLRPWEIVSLVSGFPGPVAALKFEWALTNPHLSLHIPSESRLSVAHQKKRNGHPRRPPASMQSILANLHLLLRVPSFARWPLRLHIFVPEVYAAWNKWASEAAASAANTIEVVTDFRPSTSASMDGVSGADAPGPGPAWGVHALPLDYGPMRDYVDKVQDIFTFEREGDCTVCRTALLPGKGLYAVCPNTGCEAAGHLRCWSDHLLESEAASKHGCDHTPESLCDAPLVPRRGHCPTCGGPVVWADMMKELTLRLRAPSEVDKLVKAKRRQEKATAKLAAEAQKAADLAARAASPPGLDADVPSPTKTTKSAVKATRTRKRATEVTAKAAKITKTARVTKATSSALTKAEKPAKTAARSMAAGQASAVLLDQPDVPEIIIL
ncbi:Slx4p interacting protein [Sporothrix epigloea]|uniref:Slx4p interacting protein n=1 Tax=Sporothrix epigloea TaxID=1892477 RepID=A0ABP0DJY7_9PEZI